MTVPHPPASPLRIAVLMNGSSIYKSDVELSFTYSIQRASPPTSQPQVDFFDPIVAQKYPPPADYDLIILSGGSTDPMSNTPWVLKLQAYIRATVSNFPRMKILGICWGHQTLAITFDGIVGPMDRAEISVNTISLTPVGTSFFSTLSPSSPPTSLSLLEYHGREIKTPGIGFTALAEKNHSFVNEANTILTFQGHPEIEEAFAVKMLRAGPPSYMGFEVGSPETKKMEEGLARKSDGLEVWRRILSWVEE